MHQLSNELIVLAARLVREVRRSNTTIPAASMRLLSLLDELGPSTVSVLAQADRSSQPSMTGLVGGLVDKGWLRRDPHPSDARANLVSMTPLGEQTLAELRQHNAAGMAERIARTGHSPDDLALAVQVLADLLAAETPTTV